LNCAVRVWDEGSPGNFATVVFQIHLMILLKQ